MGGNQAKQEQTIRYAPYLESWHQMLLGTYDALQDQLIGDWSTENMGATPPEDPYKNYVDIDIEDSFFGAGYTLASFPSLYDMFGKFMAGLDIDVLHDEIHQDIINGTVVGEAITQEASRLEDDLELVAYPRMEAGMRDINAVMSSTFVIARAQLEANRQLAIARFAADARYRLLPVVTERWAQHLNWNKSVIEMYANVMKFYFITRMDTDNQNMEIGLKHLLWPYTILEYSRVAVGTFNGAQNVTNETTSGSRAQKMIGGALVGASAGASVGAQIGAIGGPLGMGIGAGIGFLSGLL